MTPIVEGRGLTRTFPMRSGPVTALRDVSIEIVEGEYVAITGPSGCGKSTLLHLLGCVDAPTSGSLLFEGHDAARLTESARSRIRLSRIGFVFQRFFLLPMLDAWENVELPQAEIGIRPHERRARTRDLLEYVGLSDRAHHRPSQLSGGEMQRVAIARALANRPALLLADEPTGELDEDTGEQIADLFDRVHADGTAIVVVTHNPLLARRARRHLAMKRGTLESVSDVMWVTAKDTRDTKARTVCSPVCFERMTNPDDLHVNRAAICFGDAVPMMLRVAWRSLMTRPIRAAVLAAGFGFGIGVMAALLGVGQIILEQAHAPALNGGGDLVMYGPFGSVSSARFLISSVFTAPDLADLVKTASPSRSARLFLMTPKGPVTVGATAGIPSLEKSLGGEVSGLAPWVDAPGDERWRHPDRGEVLRAMDRFHIVPDVSTRATSWAEWLYFNGRSRDGRLRVYVTFLVGPRATTAGMRRAGVRLQLERDGRSTNYSAQAEVAEALVLAQAPDLEIAGNRVRLDGQTYRITLALAGLSADIVLDAQPGRSLPPASIRGTGGWVSGYVVPVLSGAMRGTLRVGGESLTLDASGYHDHNWGFWEGVSWQWGQVAHEDLSVVYGRVFPPADVADPARVPGFLTLLGPDGPLAFSTNVTIDDASTNRIHVRATGRGLDLQLELAADETVRTPMTLTALAGGLPLNFFQLGGTFHVTGTVSGRQIDFTARGSAETFKPQTRDQGDPPRKHENTKTDK